VEIDDRPALVGQANFWEAVSYAGANGVEVELGHRWRSHWYLLIARERPARFLHHLHAALLYLI
jgi:hypothetical protein